MAPSCVKAAHPLSLRKPKPPQNRKAPQSPKTNNFSLNKPPKPGKHILPGGPLRASARIGPAGVEGRGMDSSLHVFLLLVLTVAIIGVFFYHCSWYSSSSSSLYNCCLLCPTLLRLLLIATKCCDNYHQHHYHRCHHYDDD